jgi:C1A family cysteine protease
MFDEPLRTLDVSLSLAPVYGLAAAAVDRNVSFLGGMDLTMAIDLSALQSQIADLGLQWRAGVTSNSDHSELEARSRTGYVPGPDDWPLEEAERIAAQGAVAAVAAGPVGAPAVFDWRNRGGQNFVTPITNQGGCGSCVAFGAVAAMESLVRISRGSPTANVDLSEAHLWFCWGPSHGAGACPAGGWWPDAAFDGLKQGIVDAACYPYTAANQACNPCADWQNRLTKITGWHKLMNQAAMKEFISTVGPVSACFTVYEDFYYHYTGGVYTYNAGTAGKVVGGHCICIVGYDDSQNCWIAKNSWGSGWGESGYFRMSYGSCGLDAQMWAPEGIVGGGGGSRLEVFARGSDQALWHQWQTAPNNGWSGWASLGGWIDAPVVARNADGRLEVFVIGSDHALWHQWQTAPNNGWSGWASLGGWIDELSVGQNADGRLEVFARGSDKALWHQWQTAPNNGWSGWASLGGWIDRIAVGQNAPVRTSAVTPSMLPPAMSDVRPGGAMPTPGMAAESGSAMGEDTMSMPPLPGESSSEREVMPVPHTALVVTAMPLPTMRD